MDFYWEMILWDRSHKYHFYATGPAELGLVPRKCVRIVPLNMFISCLGFGAPHLENACPAFLKSTLIVNSAHGGDDVMTQTSRLGGQERQYKRGGSRNQQLVTLYIFYLFKEELWWWRIFSDIKDTGLEHTVIYFLIVLLG